MKNLKILFTILFFLVANTSFAEKQTMGLIEKARIYPGALEIDAKLDTGADMCSLNAQDIVMFKKGEDDWVKFSVVDRYGKKQNFEQEVIRKVRIKRIGGKAQIRNMIRIGLCLGNVYKLAEISLVDRGKYNFQLLIGKRYLSGDFVVDPSITYTLDPNCKK